MGSYTSLTIDEYPIFSSKSYVGNISCIFCESDKKIFNRSIKDRNKIVWGNINSEDIEIAYEYQTTVGIAIERLEVMGYSLNKTKLDFIESKNKLIEEYTEILECSDCCELTKLIYSRKIEFLQPLQFDDFVNAFCEIITKRLIKCEIDKDSCLPRLVNYLVEDGEPFDFPCSEDGFYYRTLLESCDKNALVIQDITEVVNAGYYKPEDKIINDLMENQEKITILTEGTSDINIISKSIQLLYPHLFDYYNFKDFKISNASGNAHQLFLEIKSLIAINHKGKIIALFDNDGEGLKWFDELKNIKIPENFVILTYPDIPLLENYPSENDTNENFNRIAGSIEMYLGKDILREEGKFIPIEISTQSIPQGAIRYKSKLQKKYFKKISKCKKDRTKIEEFDWSEMKLLLNKVFQAFKT
ncbi:MAG: HEPN/Toprim-associated domain-containing protein [Arcobacteraceae bacterium]|nr:HEPN/Toprim-associated domain-containing protein [Arcobacteraceae bacterium]